MTYTTTHTPGPWAINDDWRGVYIEEPGKVLKIATLIFGRGEPETLANARLIAAAPDMVAALETVLLAHRYDGAMTLGTAGLSPAIAGVVERAIAKAKGA